MLPVYRNLSNQPTGGGGGGGGGGGALSPVGVFLLEVLTPVLYALLQHRPIINILLAINCIPGCITGNKHGTELMLHAATVHPHLSEPIWPNLFG